MLVRTRHVSRQVLALSEHAVESALSTEDDVFIKDDVIRMSSVRTWMFNLEGAGVLRRGTARSLLSRWMTENQGVDDTATVLMKNRSSFKVRYYCVAVAAVFCCCCC